MTERTGWQMVVAALKTERIRYVYGLPGNPSCLYDALYDEPSIEPILVRHEAAVRFASPGPGVANLVPALLESLAMCAPVIAVCTGVNGHLDGKGASLIRERHPLDLLVWLLSERPAS